MKTMKRMAILLMGCALVCGACGNKTENTNENETDSMETTSTVYLTREISPEALVRIYKALGVEATGRVAVKMSTGEGSNPNYLKPELIKDLVAEVDGTIVECNTAYGNAPEDAGDDRNNSLNHRKVIERHGFTPMFKVDIMDEDGDMKIPVRDTTHLKYDIVGSHMVNYDFMIALNHFKGHPMGGYGGALKNLSIGCGSQNGKACIDIINNQQVTATNDPTDLLSRIDKQHGVHTIDHAAKIGLGSKQYQIVNIDEDKNSIIIRNKQP